MRYPTLELGAGDVNDADIDYKNDIRPLPHIDYIVDAVGCLRATAPNSLSIITSAHLIEHMDEAEQKAVCAEAHRVLIPGGMFLCWTPDREWMDDALASGAISQEWYDTLLTGGGTNDYDYHRRLLTQDDMRQLLAEAGFTVHSVREVGGSIEAVAFKEAS